jgi:glutamate N-acetyltransferase/amino-acid N-acetyltransferase
VSVTAAKGFAASGVASGIKTGGALDLALVAAQPALASPGHAAPVAAAAVFTTNLAAAAPVQLSRANLQATGGRVAAVILNSGCANAATGDEGRQAAQRMCAAVAASLGVRAEEVLVCSTGLIGPRLAVERIEQAVPGLAGNLGSRHLDGSLAARAIMTTDSHDKQAVAHRNGWSVGGMVKGAGMIAPNMATMLCVLTTDAAAEPDELAEALRAAVAVSFNALTVDGCTSTNDTVILLASGAAGAVPIADLTSAVTEVCEELAGELALDAEGTTKVARIVVSGAASDEDARLAARGVAESLLVKTSLFGADPYWGRIVSELGSSGAAFELDKVRVAYSGIVVCEGGADVEHDEHGVATHLAGRVVELSCDLGLGSGMALVVGTDLGHGYINENMRTS